MKVWVLAENTACRDDLRPEHGLSLYIEAGERRILFDMGQSGAFGENAERMGVDLSRVDFAVISHGHYDHGGGLRRFLEINSKAKVYLSQYATGAFYNRAGKYIGLDVDDARLIFVENEKMLGNDCALVSGNGMPELFPVEGDGLQVEKDGCLMIDDFCHELYLVMEENGKRVCFTGCGHRGAENILQWTQADVLVGGMHLRHMERSALEKLADRLEKKNIRLYTGHCTGESQLAYLMERLGAKPLSAGCVYEI